VDIAFRRLVTELVLIRKLMGSPRPSPSFPEVKYPWGIFLLQDLDPESMLADVNNPRIVSIRLPMILNKDDWQIYDTRQQIVRSAPAPLRHTERKCENYPNCEFHKTYHE